MIQTAPLIIGPGDDGRAISDWDFDVAVFEPGHKYELIDGRVAVASEPDPPECGISEWLNDKLKEYAKAFPRVINFVTQKARVCVPARRRLTVPEPDVAAYVNFPASKQRKNLGWHDVSPIFVAEVLIGGNPEKDLVRNSELYFLVPSIREYWLLDGLVDSSMPSLIRHVRRGRSWSIRNVDAGGVVTTPLFPGLSITLNLCE
jgi:Uma2 family endonuclease